jgi:Predicted metal-binding integral membrane protein (DUF2182)
VAVRNRHPRECLTTTSYWLAGAILIADSAWQLTPIKGPCLRPLPLPAELLVRSWRPGRFGALLQHGAYCLGCCWKQAGPAIKNRFMTEWKGAAKAPHPPGYVRRGVCSAKNSLTRARVEVRSAPVFHSGMNSQLGMSFESSSEIG